MTDKVLLFDYKTDPPNWWTNVMDYYITKYGNMADASLEVDNYLEENHLRFSYDANTRSRYIEFENKEELVMIMLKWS